MGRMVKMLQVRRPAFTELTMLSRTKAAGQVDVFYLIDMNYLWEFVPFIHPTHISFQVSFSLQVLKGFSIGL